jgi:hypothetical protein
MSPVVLRPGLATRVLRSLACSALTVAASEGEYQPGLSFAGRGHRGLRGSTGVTLVPMTRRDEAWEAVHEALMARWHVGPVTFDPGPCAFLWEPPAGRVPGRGKAPPTVSCSEFPSGNTALARSLCSK